MRCSNERFICYDPMQLAGALLTGNRITCRPVTRRAFSSRCNARVILSCMHSRSVCSYREKRNCENRPRTTAVLSRNVISVGGFGERNTRWHRPICILSNLHTVVPGRTFLCSFASYDSGKENESGNFCWKDDVTFWFSDRRTETIWKRYFRTTRTNVRAWKRVLLIWKEVPLTLKWTNDTIIKVNTDDENIYI